MNTLPEGRDIDPREWERQERAMGEEPGYRRVAQALRRSPGEPPADFAASVAALAAADAAAHAHASSVPATPEGRVERWLLRALGVVLVVASVAALARYGGDWLVVARAGFDALVPLLGGASALNWALAAGACMGLSWAFTQGAPRLLPPRH